jgi:HlyD family secretion protein
MGMKRPVKIVIVVGGILAVLVVGFLLLRGKIFPASVKAADPAYNTVKVTRGDIVVSVTPNSGQFQPSTITTIRPDSNMPTRKLVSILVKEGDRVTAGQALAKIDATGLDLDVLSAQANYTAQKVKLDNLKAKPAGMDLASAQASLTQAKANLDGAQENYDSVKALADKDLASKSQLADAERQLSVSKLQYDSAQLSYQNVKSQSQDDLVPSQEAAVAQADNDLQKAKIIFDSVVIRSPVSGVVADIPVAVGDLVGPSTAIMTVINPDPMLLLATVNENDMSQIKAGDPVAITPSAYPDTTIKGKVTQVDLKAQTQSNVSVFTATIEVPNKDGKILWGMTGDADITVLDVRDVLTLPNTAIRQSNGVSQVTILDGGKQISWDVQVGATDGSQTQIVAGLDEGTEVVVARRTATSTTNTQNRQGGGPGGGFGEVFRVIR